MKIEKEKSASLHLSPGVLTELKLLAAQQDTSFQAIR